MVFLLPLVEWLVPLIALALCALVAAFAVPIVNFVHTGITWFDKAIAFLTNKAIDLGIEFTQWLAPHFLENANRIVNYFHQLGQLAFYAGHFAWRTAVTMANYENWLANVYLPRKFSQFTGHAVDLTRTIYRTIPLSKAQIGHIESAIETHLRNAIAGTIPIAVPRTWPKINWTPKHWKEWLGLGALGGALTLPHGLSWERWLAGKLGKLDGNLAKRLRHLNYLTAFAGVGALVAAGLAKIGLGWMTRCNNLRHIGPSFCGANLKALIALFEGLAAVVGTFSLIAFAKFLQPLIVDGAKAALHFWQADVESGIDQAFGEGGGGAVRDPGFGTA